MKRKHPISDWDRAHTEDFVREVLKRFDQVPVGPAMIDSIVERILATLPDKENAR
jgi:hypothetical protein